MSARVTVSPALASVSRPRALPHAMAGSSALAGGSSQKSTSVGTLRLLVTLPPGKMPCVEPPPSSMSASSTPSPKSLFCSVSRVMEVLSHHSTTLPLASQPTAVRAAARATSGVRSRYSLAPPLRIGTPERKLPPRSVSIRDLLSLPMERPQSRYASRLMI